LRGTGHPGPVRSAFRHYVFMVSATADLLRQYPDERERERAIAWLGWIACRDGDRDGLPWWGIAALLPAGQVQATRRIAQSVIVTAVAIVSFGVIWPGFSPWGFACLLPLYLYARRRIGQRGGRRAPVPLPPARPRAVALRWPPSMVSAAVAPVLARQVHATYVVALQRQFAADGELAAYAQVSRAFTGRLVPFPVLVEIVRDVHAKDGPAHGEPGATTAEADLARRLGRLQAAVLGLSPPSLDPAAQAAASDAGLDGPLRSATDLGQRVAATGAEQDKADASGKRVELAAELAAKAVAATISIPQVSSNEVVQVITEYLSGLIEDSPLKGVFAAWLEHLPRPAGQQPHGEQPGGQAPPDGATMVVPDPAALALAAQDQMFRQARADGVLPPLADPFANGPVSAAASLQSAVDLASQSRDIQRGGTCTGCARLPDTRDEPHFDRRPFEP
jgi:hypothetical protein